MTQEMPILSQAQATDCYRQLEQLDADSRQHFNELKGILKSNATNSKILLMVQEWAFHKNSQINYSIHRVLDILEPYCDLPENND
ncbi:hypothetical protein LP109_03475 [Moraxella bovis]|uniref:hypothetical protein n=1 Tax=Moraxella bovis TaxID=476 RepID=UPI0022268230|nr:hypothetical protein [Moraxella bovis]UZA17385.1 hypothetical protein LP109_03475 [Moraxella bovis]